MKRIVGAVVAAIVIGLAAPAAQSSESSERETSAGQAAPRVFLQTLGRRDAIRQGKRQLRKYYGNRWRYGFKRQVWVFKRLGRTRLRLAYVFNGRKHGGYITVWRSGKGYISSYISPKF